MRKIANIILIGILLFSVKITEAQIEVDQTGHVSIGPYTPSSSYILNTGNVQLTDLTADDINSDYANISATNYTSTCLETNGKIFFDYGFVGMHFGAGNYIFEGALYPETNGYGNIGTSNMLFRSMHALNFSTSSDMRLKENIREIPSALNKIKQLNGVQYDLKRDFFMRDSNDLNAEMQEKIELERKDIYGFIAQDVEKILPSVVFLEDSASYYSIDYTKIVPICVNAIKEQQEMIEQLQLELSLLKSETVKKVITDQSNSKADKADEALLYQNVPNPFSENTKIRYFLPDHILDAHIIIYDMTGIQLKSIPLVNYGESSVDISAGELKAGMYIYSLLVDGEFIESKQMIITD